MSLATVNRKGSDVKITFEETGPSTGSPLVFLHGLGASRTQTTSGLSDLQNTRLIAPDMLGHGDSVSEDPEAVLSFDQSADDVIAILDQLGIEQANVGGLSMGSGIALNIALRYPQRVNRLVLLRPSWLDQKQPHHLALVGLVGQWIQEDGETVAQENLLAHPDYQALCDNAPKVAASIHGLFKRPRHFSHTAVLYKMWEDAPFGSLNQLATIKHPALVLCTTRDNLHPIPIAETIANALPNLYRLKELPPRYDQPDQYKAALNTAVNEFLLVSQN